MADTYYAWSNFEVLDDKEPGNPKKMTRIAPGEKVTPDSLGMDKEEFQSCLNAGVIRTQEYPDMGDFQGSPVEWRKAQLAAAASEGYFDTQYGSVMAEDVAKVDATKSSSVEPGTNAGANK